MLSSSIFPERSIALVKRLAGSPKGAEIDPNLPHSNKKSVTKVAHAFLYTLMDFFQSHQPPAAFQASYLLPYSLNVNCTIKRLAGSKRRLKLIPTSPSANKWFTPRCSTRILCIIDGLSVAPTSSKRLLSLLPFSLNV
jgi:hypothetical protein